MGKATVTSIKKPAVEPGVALRSPDFLRPLHCSLRWLPWSVGMCPQVGEKLGEEGRNWKGGFLHS